LLTSSVTSSAADDDVIIYGGSGPSSEIMYVLGQFSPSDPYFCLLTSSVSLLPVPVSLLPARVRVSVRVIIFQYLLFFIYFYFYFPFYFRTLVSLMLRTVLSIATFFEASCLARRS